MPDGCGKFASSSALERDISTIPTIKGGPAEIECNGAETIVKFCLQSPILDVTIVCLQSVCWVQGWRGKNVVC